ncbi:hypothetical protein HNQ56_001563 [Anaerotaenia torta]
MIHTWDTFRYMGLSHNIFAFIREDIIRQSHSSWQCRQTVHNFEEE